MQSRSGEKIGRLAGWFKGESEPITIGILPSPTKEKADPFRSQSPSSEVQPTKLLHRMSTATSISKSAMASRFSFFSNKTLSTKPMVQPDDLDDELIKMDISAALVPAGAPEFLTPAAFQNLQQQAEALLLRLQAAYKERTMSYHEMAAEKEAFAEEAEGAETRAHYARTQLDDLSVQLAEQDEIVMNLVNELALEKLTRQEEEEMRKRSVRLVEHAAISGDRDRRASLSNPVSDSGFESEDDNSADSVFSKPAGAYSPAMSLSSVSTSDPTERRAPDFEAQMPSPLIASQHIISRAGKGTLISHPGRVAKEQIQSECANLDCLHASEAWKIVSLLQEENKCMKQRVNELEGALDGCLDFVDSLS